MLDKVISIISEYQDIPADTIHADSHLVNDLGFTSYDVVSLVGKFEDEFDIEVPDRKIKLMKTVDDIVKFIEAATEE
ncbi:MAG: acyl carrier protein [Clostridia bacterium]|nr:acyl carrier protein [Clostridia bacterium]